MDARLSECRRLRGTDADVVRATIASAILDAEVADSRLGDVVLLPHQVDAVRRLRPLLVEAGGALLADSVGLGKTYVALALAREAIRPLVVAPAALRATWALAVARAKVPVTFATTESLSRAFQLQRAPDFVIVDEAHHFRTPRTKRYLRLAQACSGARVLLLSATPVHNRARDLEHLLALFLGARARVAPHELLARVIVKRAEGDIPGGTSLPELRAARWLHVPHDDDLLDAIAALPPAVPPAGGGDAGVLALWSLVRQWASSRAALAAALQRRIARALAMEATLAEGRLPTSGELAAWRFADGALQLALPGLLAPAGTTTQGCAALLDTVVRHRLALEALLARLREGADPDLERAALLSEVRAGHRGARIVAFSEFEATISALFRLLVPAGGVAMLTARGARVSGGELTRQDVLDRFAPRAQGARARGPADDVTFLLATELLSEGVNLQDAEVVVHLDLPWNPARLEQRVGRVRRIGGERPVHVYALAPPAAAERLLQLQRRLQRKLAVAGRAVGLHGSVLPPLLGSLAPASSEAEIASQVRTVLAAWRASSSRTDAPVPLACSVRSRRSGFVALVRLGDGGPQLACARDGPVSTSPRVIAECLSRAGGAPLPLDTRQLQRAHEAIAAWARSLRLERALGTGDAALARARRHVLRRIAAIEGSLPRHERAALAPLIARARDSALVPLGAHAERELEVLVGAASGSADWLRAVVAACSENGAPRTPSASGASHAAATVHVDAIILLTPPASPS